MADYYTRNTAGDLVYDPETGSYIPAEPPVPPLNVISISQGAFLQGGYVNPNITSVDLNHIPFTSGSMSSSFISTGSAKLTTVTNINDNTTSMIDTFYNCQNLTSIDKFPDNVINIQGCFYKCKNLTHVPTIPNSVTDISFAFGGCNHLTSVPDMPDSVTRAVEAYYAADRFTTPPKLSSSLNPDYGLSRTFYFTSITDIPAIPNTITDLYMTFTQCSGLYNLATTANRLPDSITNMYLTFAACFNLVKAPVIPNSVVSLYSTFAKCFNLVNAPAIPNSVRNMAGTFYQCYNLVNAPVLPEGLETLGEGGHDIYPLHQYGAGCFSCTGIVNAPVIPNSVTNMSGCFGDCHSLVNTPVIPSNVTDMGTCFMNCRAAINFPAVSPNVVNIADCFAGCTRLVTAPVIPRNVTRITGEFFDGLFSRCTNLTGDIYIMSNQINYANQTFSNTLLAKNVYIPFRKPNGAYTSTYNAFIRAGYDEIGTKEGVTLKDCEDLKVFTLCSDRMTSDIILKYNNKTVTRKGSASIAVEPNTTIEYEVSEMGYKVEIDTITVTDQDVYRFVSITIPIKEYDVTYDSSEYTSVSSVSIPNAGSSLRVYATTKEQVNLASDFTIEEVN